MRHSTLRLTMTLAFLAFSRLVFSDPAPVVVCYPGGPVSEEDANKAMSAMLGVVERVGGWPSQTFSSAFSSDVEGCKTLLKEKKPSFAITSLGIFLDQRQNLHLEPVVQPKMRGGSTEQFHLVAVKGRFASLEDLKGKLVGGTVFEESDFIRRVVFAGKLDPEKDFSLKPSKQAIRALRALDKGELDAILLNGQQFAALASLPLTHELDSVFTSAPIPLMGLVANQQTSTPEERNRFARALSDMCKDTDGKKLCELFAIDAFVPASLPAIQPVITLWDKGR
jgi:ABC transporter, phosphonate, periplasmic substrate-binding protein